MLVCYLLGFWLWFVWVFVDCFVVFSSWIFIDIIYYGFVFLNVWVFYLVFGCYLFMDVCGRVIEGYVRFIYI